MQIKIRKRFPTLSVHVPGVALSATVAQDEAMPEGIGTIRLTYAAAGGGSSKLQLRCPGQSGFGTISSDLDTGDPTGTVLTGEGGVGFLVIDVTSATLAAVHTSTDYDFTVGPQGQVVWECDADSVAAGLALAVSRQVDLTGAVLDGENLAGAILEGGKLAWSSFVGANLIGASLVDANLSYADFTSATLTGTVFTNATTTGVTWTGADEKDEVVGGLRVGKTATSTDVTLDYTSTVVAFTTGSGSAKTVTIPTAVGHAGQCWLVWKEDAGTTAGQIASTSSQTFNGAAGPLSLPTRYHAYLIWSDGANLKYQYLVPWAPIAATEKAAASGVASLDVSSKVVQNPANATATPTASKIPIADGSGKLAAGWGGAASTLATLDAGALVVENPANATATPTASKIPIADGAGKLAAGWGGLASTLATLDGSAKVVEDPANATATPTASKIPIADGAGKLAAGWGGAATTLATLDGSTKVVEDPANATATPTASKIPIAGASGELDGWAYVPTTAADWNGAAPATIRAGLDRCATLLKTLNGGTGP